MENLDLTKILKDCPEGTPLYSAICGEVKFKGIIKNAIFLKKGTYCNCKPKK